MIKKYFYCIFYCGLLLFMASCQKQTPLNQADNKKAPIDLTITEENGTLRLDWTEVKVSDFVKYEVYRLTDSIFDAEGTPFPDGLTQTIFDYRQNEFIDTLAPLSSKIHYRVFAYIGNRIISSNDVVFNRKLLFVQNNCTDILQDDEHNIIYLWDKFNFKIDAYDYGRDSLLGTILLSPTFSADVGFPCLNTFNGQSEIYVPISGAGISIYDGLTLALKGKIPIATTLVSVAASGNLIFVSNNNFSNPIAVYDRSTKQPLISGQGLGNYGKRLYALSTGNELVAINNDFSYDAYYYIFNTTTGAFTQSKVDSYNGFINFDPYNITHCPANNQFIIASQGLFFEKNLTFKGIIAESQGSFDWAFSDDGSKIYSCSTFGNFISEINPVTFGVVNNFLAKNFPFKVLADDNQLLVIEQVFDPNTFLTLVTLEKINI